LACAGSGTVSERALGGVDDEVLTHYRLEYSIEGERFTYSTYEVEGSGSLVQVLTDGTAVLAVSPLADAADARAPAIRACTLFPVHGALDVNGCFAAFNAGVLAQNDTAWRQALTQPGIARQQETRQAAGTLAGTAAALAPVIVPAAVLAAPVLVFDYLSAAQRREQFHLRLGVNPMLQSYLATFDDRAKSIVNGHGTAYVEAGVTLRTPAVAFGFQGDEVVWIQRRPSWSCGGGFMFWGNSCRIGRHPRG